MTWFQALYSKQDHVLLAYRSMEWNKGSKSKFIQIGQSTNQTEQFNGESIFFWTNNIEIIW